MIDINTLKKTKNIAELLDDNELALIGSQVVKGYEIDEESRSEWKEVVDKAMDIAKQKLETKNYPWPNSSNIKFPLITQAAIDYAARTLPEVIQNNNVVKATVVGLDPTREKEERARRVSEYMSYQLLQENPEWEDGIDKLLQILPVLGTVFKKIYYDPISKKVMSDVCVPDKIVVNYDSASLDAARRITHILDFYINDVVERIRAGVYRDIDLDILRPEDADMEGDDDYVLQILEQHCYLDLDGDGYKEPYAVTVHKGSGEVLRISHRFKSIEKNKEGEIKRIVPEQHFTDFHFIRSPDGGFYSMGFGALLLPLNKAINTLINQLVDSGTLNNSQGGFIGRGLRMKNGEFKLRLGEWKVLDAASGTNISQNIVPLPTKEPSQTLFQLLGLLMQMGKDLSSTTDVLQGKQPAQNVAQGTIATLVEQGVKVFTAINKRVYRALKKEYQKIYDLNKRFLSQEEYQKILDDPNANKDIDFEAGSYDIYPISDPQMTSMAQKLIKTQSLMQVPGINPYEASKAYLEAMQLPKGEIDKLLPAPDPQAPPPPEVQKLMAEIEKLQAEVKVLVLEAQVTSEAQMLDTAKLNIQRDEAMSRVRESEARIVKMQEDATVNRAKLQIVDGKAQHEAVMKELDHQHKKDKDEVELSIKATDVINKDKSKED